jgi:hypothetical protein
MISAFPLRPQSHQLEELSERFFRQSLPKNWTADKPLTDYGVDLRVDMYEGDQATGLELLVQLKASAQPTDSDTEVVQLKISTYNLLWGKLQVAMLVKYVEAENEGYWLLFKDIPEPSQKQETFSIRIPKSNRLSAAPWDEIQAHVRNVTDRKLAAVRRSEIAPHDHATLIESLE